MASKLPVIAWDYDFSPYGQKVRGLLHGSKIAFTAVNQPVTLPRPDLTGLGITYRRIPVLSIGKDVYCDSSAIIRALQRVHAGATPPAGPADAAYETFGNAMFGPGLPVMPGSMLTPEFVRDRETIFPALKSPQFPALRPSALAEMRDRMATIEDTMLVGDGPFIGGARLSMADVHVVWSIRWLLTALRAGEEPGFGRDAFPKLWKWFDSCPPTTADKVDVQTGHKTLLGSGYVDDEVAFDEKDPLGIRKGASVIVEGRDTKPGAHPQAGKLIGLDKHELVLQLDNGIRLHFPRAGYAVFEAGSKL